MGVIQDRFANVRGEQDILRFSHGQDVGSREAVASESPREARSGDAVGGFGQSAPFTEPRREPPSCQGSDPKSDPMESGAPGEQVLLAGSRPPLPGVQGDGDDQRQNPDPVPGVGGLPQPPNQLQAEASQGTTVTIKAWAVL